MGNKYAIVVVGYNRKKGLERVLQSVSMADYCGDRVDLIISLDYCGNAEIESIARKFIWNYGEKSVKTHSERLGLKKHILECGRYLKQYDAIVVLEDDVIVASGFYNYMRQAVEQYESDEHIAGISLYNHSRNILCGLAFTPEYCGKDTYFLQVAQSWGQIWMRHQWAEFEAWMEENGCKGITNTLVPKFVRGWPDSSWLKYHIQYCIETNKFFVYPYYSFCTCYSEQGEHTNEKSALLQVAMNMCKERQKFRFSAFGKDTVRYDAFFERMDMERKVGVPDNELCVDIYGMKENHEGKRYLLSIRQYPYKIVKSYGMSLRPHENNVMYQEEGEDIFLYDRNQDKDNKKVNREIERLEYYRVSTVSNAKEFRHVIRKIVRNRVGNVLRGRRSGVKRDKE